MHKVGFRSLKQTFNSRTHTDTHTHTSMDECSLAFHWSTKKETFICAKGDVVACMRRDDVDDDNGNMVTKTANKHTRGMTLAFTVNVIFLTFTHFQWRWLVRTADWDASTHTHTHSMQQPGNYSMSSFDVVKMNFNFFTPQTHSRTAQACLRARKRIKSIKKLSHVHWII